MNIILNFLFQPFIDNNDTFTFQKHPYDNKNYKIHQILAQVINQLIHMVILLIFIN